MITPNLVDVIKTPRLHIIIIYGLGNNLNWTKHVCKFAYTLKWKVMYVIFLITKFLMLVVKFCNIMLWGCYVMYAFKNINQKWWFQNLMKQFQDFCHVLTRWSNYIDASGNYTSFFCINIKSGSILLWMIAIQSI